jgi:hypothetical protein
MTRDVTWPYRNNIYKLLYVRRQRPFRTTPPQTSVHMRSHEAPTRRRSGGAARRRLRRRRHGARACERRAHTSSRTSLTSIRNLTHAAQVSLTGFDQLLSPPPPTTRHERASPTPQHLGACRGCSGRRGAAVSGAGCRILAGSVPGHCFGGACLRDRCYRALALLRLPLSLPGPRLPLPCPGPVWTGALAAVRSRARS